MDSEQCQAQWDEVVNGWARNSHLPEIHCSVLPAMKSLPIAALKQNGFLQTLVSKGEEEEKREEADAAHEDLLKAEQEWEAVESLQTGLFCDKSGLLGDLSGQTTLISFNEALQYFQTADLSECRRRIQPTVRRSGFSVITHLLFGPPRLNRELHAERDLALAIAQCPLDSGQKVHMRVLQTIYRKLTGARFDCPRYGAHWEQLGFQGVDPGTDLRAAGLLGLMHPLYMVMEPRTLPLARDIYRLSQHQTQNFPFCIMSINITRICIQALREERLSREFNRRQQVVTVLNDFYVATFYQLYHVWKTQNKTIGDSGFILKEVESLAKRHPKHLLQQLDAHLREGTLPSPRPPDIWPQHSSEFRGTDLDKSPVRSEGEIHFTGVCEQQVQDDRLI